jgi:2-iminoacetate synthase ThiH
MEDWDELDQGSCWDWIGVGLRKRRPMRFAIHYKIVRVFVYLTHMAMPTNFCLRQCCHFCAIYTSRRAEDGTAASILNAWAFVSARH